jgi:hypothetical protein
MSKAQGIANSANQGQFKNRLINSDMRIDQRNAGASVSTNGAYGVDRWLMNFSGGGVYSAQRSTTAPTGFSNSTILSVTTSDSSIASTDFYRFRQAVEGFNISDLGWGTASAQPITISFWVRSSVTGTYCVGLQNALTNRSYGAEYTISATNTWEYKTITVAGDTTGTWSTDNGAGVYVYFDLGSGSSFNQTVNTWVGTNTWKTSAQTNWISNAGATFFLTGVQLEKGSTATSFDYRPYGTELALCQRYYFSIEGGRTSGNIIIPVSYTGSAANAWLSIFHPVTMRTAPTVTTGSWIVGDPTVVGPGVNFTSFGVNWAFYFGETSYYRATAEL